MTWLRTKEKSSNKNGKSAAVVGDIKVGQTGLQRDQLPRTLHQKF